MKYFFVVGERSGDLHASRVIDQLYHIDPECEVYAWGGHLMQNAGATVLMNYQNYSMIGFWEVLRNVTRIHSMLKACKNDLHDIQPDVLILIDFAGFNLRLAKYAKENGIKTAYYIPPKIWAWGAHRVIKIKKYIDETLVIFPFEEAYFHNQGIRVIYVGNPTFEEISQYNLESQSAKNTVAILPGSRRSEVLGAYSIITELAANYPELDFIVSVVDNLPRDLYPDINGISNVTYSNEPSLAVLNRAEFAIVTSGTATLEAALIGIPQIVIYKISSLTYLIAKYLIKIPYISLVNILLNRKLVEELIQKDYDADRIREELKKLKDDKDRQKKISEGYSEIKDILGEKPASLNAAKAIYDLGCS